MKASVKSVYTSAGCNRTPEIVDWNVDGLICFGACNAVVVYDTNIIGGDPLTVRHHHTARVNSVKWLHKSNSTCTELISCSADKTAAIWSLSDAVWQVSSKLAGHTDAVTCINGLYINQDDLIVYTASIDSTIKIWERIKGALTLKQTINLNSGLCLTLHAHLLPVVNKPLLFCGLDDHKIHVFAGEDEYNRVHMLVGHEDWVRGLDVIDADSTTILLASASQDTYIRLWRIQQYVELEKTPEIKVEEKVFNAYEHMWSVKLDAVLAGHEGWVYGVQWHPYIIKGKSKQPVYRLLSSSLDKTAIIWEPEGGDEGVWVERVRVGEVGGNGLGFYGSRFGPNGLSFMAHGYNGAFHIWTLSKESNQWQPRVVCGGHFGGAEAAAWEPRGRYLLSASADQTTRVHAPRKLQGQEPEWHEIARPQVHGYDLAALAVVDPVSFASAAEEKVIRVFRAPHNFIQNFKNIVGEDLADDTTECGPEGASVPSLGLSNKAVFDGGSAGDDDGYFVPVNLTAPPTEECLAQNTLWPETHKLYGHGYEVHALAASRDRRLLASGCRAHAATHAALLLWETKNWQQIQKLECHQLTVTQIAFSPDSQRLVSVSRDRRWTLCRRRARSDLFDVAAAADRTNGLHSRIIWCCAWTHDSWAFATGSRDGKICVWTKTGATSDSSTREYGLAGPHLALPSESVTALAFAPVTLDCARVLAAGFDSGVIRLYSFNADGWSLLHEMDTSAAHHLTVKTLAFRPQQEGDPSALMLASCGSDHFVRIHAVSISTT